jgi:predicted nucleic acid-binding protein
VRTGSDAPGAVVYLDTSALVKLLVVEEESAALDLFLTERPRRASSVVAEVELRRAARRVAPAAELDRRALELVGGLHLIDLDAPIRQLAATLEPSSLRSADAIHLASALSLAGSLDAFVAYDRRLSAAARALNLPVAEPGAS